MALEGSEGSVSCPSHSLPSGKTRYPLYRRLGGPQGWSGHVWKISPSLGFDPQTIQPVAIRYTDYATQPTTSHQPCRIFSLLLDTKCLIPYTVHKNGKNTDRNVYSFSACQELKLLSITDKMISEQLQQAVAQFQVPY